MLDFVPKSEEKLPSLSSCHTAAGAVKNLKPPSVLILWFFGSGGMTRFLYPFLRKTALREQFIILIR